MARNRKSKKSRNKNKGTVSVHRAPMQNMQQVDSWDLIDVVPIVLANQGVSVTPSDPFIFEAGFNANGWFYEVRQGGNPTAFRQALYGFNTGQFAELQALWSTYRVNKVEVVLTPAYFGAGYASPLISAIDPAGAIGPINQSNPFDDVAALSRLRSVEITACATHTCRRHFNYSDWLMQTTPQCWLATVNSAADASGLYDRQIYPEGAVGSGDPLGTTPQTRFFAEYVPQFGNTVLALMHIRAHISVRGRRGVPLGGFPSQPALPMPVRPQPKVQPATEPQSLTTASTPQASTFSVDANPSRYGFTANYKQ